ncbi:MAG: restriction endonuclease subunit S [Chryseobacterium sp.]|nr:MAG: restriction endonuclease subunit S [Chryseobacterium sp.]
MIKEKTQNIKSSNQANPINQGSDNMKQGWEIKKLGDICTIQLGKTPYRKSPKFWDKEKTSGNVWLSISDLKHGQTISESEEHISDLGAKDVVKIPKGTMMLSFKLTLGRVSFAGCDLYTNEAIASLLNLKKEIDKDFLFYYFTLFDWDKAAEGDIKVKGKTLNKKKLNELEIIVPPLPEQQRIVSILDEAFAAITKAKANAEQNLKNAKELFESYLQGVFEKRGDGWEERKVNEIGNAQTGTTPKTAEKENYGDFIPFIKPADVDFSGIGDIRYDNEGLSEIGLKKGRKMESGSILMVCIGATIGKVGFAKCEVSCNQQINSLTVKKEFEPKFIYYAMTSKEFQEKVLLEGKGAQATLPIINKSKWENLTLSFPKSKTEQQTIVRQLDALRAETQKLEAVYQKKIADLEELKKSILQKAFAGELSSSASVSVSVAKVIPLQKVEGISPTDLQAGITALALQKHIEKNHQHSFHHVKAEKIVHLSEYILNIDLERNPVKDAAGPNDFTHAKKVESRARKAGFYSVYKNGDYYDYQQGRNINSVIQKAQSSLGEKANTLSQIIDMLIPMTTQQAEIVATVFAAWNNLLLNGNKFTDEDIVTEARENWREEKLKISRDKFFNAIEWMRKNELLIPKGNGKIIVAK